MERVSSYDQPKCNFPFYRSVEFVGALRNPNRRQEWCEDAWLREVKTVKRASSCIRELPRWSYRLPLLWQRREVVRSIAVSRGDNSSAHYHLSTLFMADVNPGEGEQPANRWGDEDVTWMWEMGPGVAVAGVAGGVVYPPHDAVLAAAAGEATDQNP